MNRETTSLEWILQKIDIFHNKINRYINKFNILKYIKNKSEIFFKKKVCIPGISHTT